MAYFEDLANECDVVAGPPIRAVGWLSSARPYSTGVVGERERLALERHLVEPYEIVRAMGPHSCEFCREHLESRNLMIPHGELLFVAPAMIGHYISAHAYLPPVEFLAAVVACPEQGSREYLELLEPFLELWRVDEGGGGLEIDA